MHIYIISIPKSRESICRDDGDNLRIYLQFFVETSVNIWTKSHMNNGWPIYTIEVLFPNKLLRISYNKFIDSVNSEIDASRLHIIIWKCNFYLGRGKTCICIFPNQMKGKGIKHRSNISSKVEHLLLQG